MIRRAFFTSAKCGGRDGKSQVIKSGAQSASYMWSFKFFRAHLLFVLNVIFAGPLKVTKSSHHLSHDRASKGHGSIPCLMSQTDLHRIKSL